MNITTNSSNYMVDEAGYWVYLNGQRLIGCVRADEEAGEAIIYDRDDGGHVRAPNGNATFRRVTGEVKIYEILDRPTVEIHQP